MHRKLPKEIDPFRFAQNGIELEGVLAINTMPRLLDYLTSNEGNVAVKMKFDIDEIGTAYMHGQFKCDVSMTCERCMSPMTVQLDVDCFLALIVSERRVEGLSEQYEPWLLENNDPVAISTVIEDELILALPLIPKHEDVCLADDEWVSQAEEEESLEDEKPISPFAVLSELKTKK